MHKNNRSGFTIIETLIAFAIVAVVLSAAFKIMSDAVHFEELTKVRSSGTLALSVMNGKDVKSKDFYLSDKLRESFKKMDDDLRRSLKEKYSYKQKYYKRFELGDDELFKLRVKIEKCTIADSDQHKTSIYKIDIK